jgi:hypothetical protein
MPLLAVQLCTFYYTAIVELALGDAAAVKLHGAYMHMWRCYVLLQSCQASVAWPGAFQGDYTPVLLHMPCVRLTHSVAATSCVIEHLQCWRYGQLMSPSGLARLQVGAYAAALQAMVQD